MSDTERQRALAETVRRACIEAASAAYEQAGLSGLCAEGRWELAIDAMKQLDLEQLIASTSYTDK
jgi:hypothetical protein